MVHTTFVTEQPASHKHPCFFAFNSNRLSSKACFSLNYELLRTTRKRWRKNLRVNSRWRTTNKPPTTRGVEKAVTKLNSNKTC